MKRHYEDYWSRSSAPPDSDPLTATRHALLWKLAAQAGLESGRLLDVGCGAGELCHEAQSRGFEPVGKDISGAAIRRARPVFPDIPFFVQSVENQPWPMPHGPYDIVTSFEVIEHLMHPAELLRGAKSCLRDGGYLAISTPYHGRIKNVAISLIDFDRHFAPEGDHIRFLSDGALTRMLHREGFEVISISHYGRAPFIWAGTFVWAKKR